MQWHMPCLFLETITLLKETTHYAMQVFSGRFYHRKLSLALVVEIKHNMYLSKFHSNHLNSIFWFLLLILSEHFWALGVKYGTIFQYGRRQSVNTNVGAMEWFRGYFQSMNGGDRKWEIVRGMWLVSLALQRQHGTLEQNGICSLGRNKLLLQFTINTQLRVFWQSVRKQIIKKYYPIWPLLHERH